MKPLGALAAWLATAKPGHCPCGRKVCRKGSRLCKRTQCRKDYMDFWRMEKRGPSSKSAVTGKTPTQDGARVRIHLACCRQFGQAVHRYYHYEDLPPSLAARVGPRRRCPVCAKG